MDLAVIPVFGFLASFGGAVLAAGLIMWRIDRKLTYAARQYAREMQVKKFLNERAAVTAVEYGIIAGVLGLVLVVITHSYALEMAKLFKTIGAHI